MRLVLLIAVLLFASPASGQDRRLVPVPRPIPPLFSEQPRYGGDLQNADAKERGTENVPVVVKVIPPDPSPEDREHAAEKADLDRKLADYTGDLALYTKLLFGATGVLAFVTGWLALVASRQMKEARRAIVAAEKSASAAERALNQQPILMRAAKWMVANYGRTPALLLDRVTHWPIEIEGKLPTPIDPASQNGGRFPSGCIVGIGGAAPYIEAVNLMAVTDPSALADPSARIFFIGYVRYGDLLGGVYLNGFCLVYDVIGQSFVRIGDDRYNYIRTEKQPDKMV